MLPNRTTRPEVSEVGLTTVFRAKGNQKAFAILLGFSDGGLVTCGTSEALNSGSLKP